MRNLTAALLVAASLLASSACTPSGQVFVRVGPPAPRVEAIAVTPEPRYVWLPGYYRWDGARYDWVPGRYEVPPRPRAVWVRPHWERGRRGWYLVAGHWR
jgi:hypothetical protein